MVSSRILVQNPSAPQIIRLRSIGPLTINVSWVAPDDRGAGVGITYPLLNYQVVLQTSETGPDLGAATSQTQIIAPDILSVLFRLLQKGQRYFVFVRSRNNATEYPDELDYGWGPWSLGSAACADGLTRSSVCTGNGVIALDLPTTPQDFSLKPVGSGSIMALWRLPVDTGDGSGLYPLVKYDIQFAANDVFAPADIFSANQLQYRTEPGQYVLGQVRFSRVRAVNDAGFSDWSSTASAFPLLFPSPPERMNLCNAMGPI